MADYSLVILVGRLTKDPDLKYASNGGLAYTCLKLSVKKSSAGADGSVKKSVVLVDVTAQRHQAELCCQFLKKGSSVMVVGHLRQDRWTDDEDKGHSRLSVVADRIQFLDKRTSDSIPSITQEAP